MSEEIDAGAELVRRFGEYEPVSVAFWLKASGDAFRYLYIASDRINERTRGAAYREVLKLADEIRSPYLDPFRVKIVGEEDSLARDAADVNRMYPGRMATRYGQKSFGGISVDDVYIYPSPLATASA